jgi:hypothetical protein
VYGPTGCFLNGLETNSVEAKDAFRGGEPKISFGGLLNIEDCAETIPLGVVEVCNSADRGPPIRSTHLWNWSRNQGNADQPSELPKNCPHEATFKAAPSRCMLAHLQGNRIPCLLSFSILLSRYAADPAMMLDIMDHSVTH